MWIGPGLKKGVRGTFWAGEAMYKGLSAGHSQRTTGIWSSWGGDCLFHRHISAILRPRFVGNLEKECMKPRPSLKMILSNLGGV